MAGSANLAILPGFDDAPRQSQTVFRAVMDALARPATVQNLGMLLQPPAPLTPELAAIALALADHDAPIWLDATLAAHPAVAAYLRFHTGAPIVSDPKDAVFALVADPTAMPSFDSFALGSEDYPDRSTTIVIAVDRVESGEGVWIEGPGMAVPALLAVTPMPSDFQSQVSDNHALFPRGVDLVFAAAGRLVALPRSSRLSKEP